MKPKPKYKLVCFDLDGTIIDKTSSVWHTIHEKLGTDKEARRKAIEDFHAGRITYQQWADGDMRAWKKVGANKEKILEAIQHLRLMTGALETIQELKRKGLKLTIISGSIDLVLEKVFPNYKEFF
ncbi:HAD-IB family phosphatase, partial [Candidatus Woesearchaeota archaeon]|nr:HAD-IB family phosphatase [Candidatus Woesearchaeota archaeon]